MKKLLLILFVALLQSCAMYIMRRFIQSTLGITLKKVL